MALIYQTAFPVNKAKSINDLVEVVKTWIAGSPHRNVSVRELCDIDKEGFKFSKGQVSIESIRHDEGADRTYGVRLVEKSNATRTTDIVAHTGSAGFDFAVAHEYETQRIGDVFSGMSKPRIVKDVIKQLGGGYDGTCITTKTEPYFLIEDDLEFVADIINNSSDNRLPIIYISKSNSDQMLVHPGTLAYELCGMAHVLVEPSREFSFKLKNLTNRKNIFAGAVGIHWPNGMRCYFTPEIITPDMTSKFYNIITQAAINTIVPQNMSFDGIRGLKTAKKIELLMKEAGKAKDMDEILRMSEEEKANIIRENAQTLELFSSENELLRKQYDELAGKHRALEARLVSISNRRQDTGAIIKAPATVELYQGETADIVIDALRMYVNHVHDASRRQDIVNALLAANKSTGRNEELRLAVERIFQKHVSGNYNETMGSELRALGFAVDKGSHPKICVPGHEQKMIEIAGTPSDNHTRKNEVSDVKRKLL
jgi:hypothetical protein